mmetsp:Transcript_15544/g.41813  ORF Transcript_15544/g.41813 Transcript_15544/m.41813 type:complete len:102 (+) Transcript_15544:134-439(+)
MQLSLSRNYFQPRLRMLEAVLAAAVIAMAAAVSAEAEMRSARLTTRFLRSASATASAYGTLENEIKEYRGTNSRGIKRLSNKPARREMRNHVLAVCAAISS